MTDRLHQSHPEIIKRLRRAEGHLHKVKKGAGKQGRDHADLEAKDGNQGRRRECQRPGIEAGRHGASKTDPWTVPVRYRADAAKAF
jgi:hypothetical protein